MLQYRVPQHGITLIEVLIAITIVTAVLVVVGSSIQTYVAARTQLLADMQRVYLVEEGYEVVRALRDDSWGTIEAQPLDTPRYLSLATTTISIGATPEVINGVFTRAVVFRSVYRNSDDDIVASTTVGATVDPQLREVEVVVGSAVGTSSMQVIIANLFEPA